jgi:hypothetical protein
MPVVINEFQVVAEPPAPAREESAPARAAAAPAPPAGPADAARTLRALHAAVLRVWAH